jgi:hypothetical protein
MWWRGQDLRGSCDARIARLTCSFSRVDARESTLGRRDRQPAESGRKR